MTVEHFSKDRRLSIVQRALIDAACVQCGYCIPAVVLAIEDLLARDPDPDREAIADALAGTLCRCTGYEQFFNAVHIAAMRISDPAYTESMAPEFAPDLRHVGKDREKIDAAYLVRGERAFVEDRVDAGACHLLMLGSPHAHAWITSIDTSTAEAMPGVVAIVTHQNCPDRVYTTAGQGYPEPSPYDQRMFPRKVRHVGDRVAAVLAESLEEARAALEAIEVEYEVLKPVLSIAEAKAPGAPIVHHGKVSYVVGEPPKGSSTEGDDRDDPIIYQFPLHADPHRNLAASVGDGIGDLEKGFAEADVVIERTYRGNRVQCTPLEPHVVYAKVDGGRLILHASTQVPWHVRRIVARAIGIPELKVRVIKERVGGGFGAKQDIVLEDVAGYMAWTTGRPVLYRYTREEEFKASRTRHGMEVTVKLGARRDGKLTGILMKVDADTGPYGQHCLTVPMNAVSKSLPLVLCDNARFEVKTYYTNLSPAGAYQGYGAPKGSFALQAALAELAAELGMDQLDLIEKNRVRSGSRIEILRSLGEGRPGAAVTLGECGLGEMIERGKKAFAWDAPKPASDDPDWRIGRSGVIIQQGSGLPGLDSANAEMRLLTDGTVLVLSGGADPRHGPGHHHGQGRGGDPRAGHGGRHRRLRRHGHDSLRYRGLCLQRHLFLRRRCGEGRRGPARQDPGRRLDGAGRGRVRTRHRPPGPGRGTEGRGHPRQAGPHGHPGRGACRSHRHRRLQDRPRRLPVRGPLRRGRGQRPHRRGEGAPLPRLPGLRDAHQPGPGQGPDLRGMPQGPGPFPLRGDALRRRGPPAQRQLPRLQDPVHPRGPRRLPRRAGARGG